MIFVANKADFSSKSIGKVNIDYDDAEGDDGVTTLITSIQIKALSSSPIIGQKVQMKTIVYPLNAYMRNDLKWEVSDTKKALISDNGELSVIDSGAITVTASAKDGSEVSTSMSVTLVGRTMSDVTTHTRTILGYYNALEKRTYTDAEVLALDTLLARLGVENDGSIWSKIEFMVIPCLGSSYKNMMVNIKNGLDACSTNTSTASKFQLVNGWVKGKDAWLMTYLNEDRTKQLYINKGWFYISGGKAMTLVGSTDSWLEYKNIIYNNSRIGLTTRAGEEYYQEISLNNKLRGATSDNTQSGTYFYPVVTEDEITRSVLTGWDGYIARVNSREWCLSKTQIKLESDSAALYVYAFGRYLTQDELNTLGDSLNKFFVAMGVDTTLYM